MTWLQRLLCRQQLEGQLENELRFHLEQHAADLIARGQQPQEARRQARLALGGPEQVKEECRDRRGTRWLEDLGQDIRYALRTLRMKPGFAAVALSTLALGIGATTVMFAVVNGVLLKPLPYPDPARLVTLLAQTDRYGENWGISYPDFLDCQRQSRSLAPMAAWSYDGGTATDPGEAEHVESRNISADLFSVFGVPMAAGRAFVPDEDRPGGAPVAIISYRFWQSRYGGDAQAIGKRLVFDGRPYVVVGVGASEFQLDGEADVFTPLGQNPASRMRNRDATFLHVVARLQPGVTAAQAYTDLALIGRHLAEQYPQSNAGRRFLTEPLGRGLVGAIGPTLWLLLGAVSLVLLIACVNVASLLLARAVSQERELALRVALGAGRSRLVRQCLAESAVLGLFGGTLGILLAAAGVRPFVLLWPGTLPRAGGIALDARVLVFALAASVLCGLLFGLAPAFRAPARELETALRSGARSVAGGTRRMHSGFVVSEIALAIVLLVAARILGRTLLRLSSLNPGVNIRNVLTARVALSPSALQSPAQARVAWRELLDRARSVPGVQTAAVADIIPMRVGTNGLPYSTGPSRVPANQLPIALATCVTPDHLKVMGIPLRDGRFFDDRDQLGREPVVVIDEELARHAFAGQEPVGKRLWIAAMGPDSVRVVGVVGHVRHWGLADDDQSQIRDQIYYPFSQVPDPLMRLFSSLMSVAVRTSVPPLSLIEPLRREIRGTGDQTLYDVHTMEQLVSDSLARQRFLLALFGIFAGLALLLACIGIYGVLTYITSQRVPEIGVRLALGATARDVVRMVLRQSLGMIVAGVGLGLAASLASARLLERSVVGVQRTGPLTFATMILVLAIAALLASFLPARRAARIDPMRALRQE